MALGICGLRPLLLNENSTVPEYGSSDSAKGGTNLDVPPGAWPGIASVQVTMENGTWHMCSGALISHCWVLTAASCFSGAGAVVEWKVVIGATDLAEPGPEAEVFQIKRILVHHGYVAATATNNIALLELEQPVECSDYIQLGCVPDSSLALGRGLCLWQETWGVHVHPALPHLDPCPHRPQPGGTDSGTAAHPERASRAASRHLLPKIRPQALP
ncbi:hypothetical protein IHE44_0012700 [Lamprotornis superbus]|uniref:Peptidase S1 domain-containing protein n=1 Tax=Lamprotornis superbus TaxID=245042 RepID=A0A835TNS1_9PASS|nr:hypothetical protein IHE44_0012700 [Lamprotornis superbus]